MKLATEKFD